MPSVSLAGSNSAQISRSNLSPESHGSTGSVIKWLSPRKILRDSQYVAFGTFGVLECSYNIFIEVIRSALSHCHSFQVWLMALQRTWGHVSRIQIAKSMNGASGAQLGTGRWHWSFNGKSNGSCIIICSPFIWTDNTKKALTEYCANDWWASFRGAWDVCCDYLLCSVLSNVSSLTPLVSDRGVASWLKLLILRVHIVHGPMCRWPKLSHWCVAQGRTAAAIALVLEKGPAAVVMQTASKLSPFSKRL